MAKPKIDFKKLLLERGERIGLSVAGVITLLLLLVSLLWPGKGLFSGSPDEKAKGLIAPADYINQRLNDPNNTPGEADMPDKNSDDKLIALNMKSLDSEDYRMASMIPATGGGGTGRRFPRVLTIDDARIKVARMQIQTYMMDTNGNIYVLVGEKGSAKGSQADRSRMFGKGGRMMGGMAGMGGRGMPGMGGRGMGRGRFGLPPGAGGNKDDEKPSKKLVAMPLEKLATNNAATPAERVHPMRMAIIAASFPYKAQIEEFRSKLALRSATDVLTESGVEKVKGRVLPSFYFTGVDVERRELDGDGKPITAYTTLKLKEDYQPYVILSGARFEDDDPDLLAISFPGLVMPRLRGFRPESAGKGEGMGGPGIPGGPMGPRNPMGSGRPMPPPVGKGPGDGNAKEEGAKHKELYPAVERELPEIRKTLESLKGKADVAAPPSRFQGIGDIFDPTAEPMGKDAGMGDKPMTGDGMKTDADAVREIPEHCLVRVIDVTIQPGKTYEYRLRVKMLNPNYKRLDVASPAYAEAPDLPSDWSKQTLRVQIQPELRYYAVDQKKINAENLAELGKYDGPNANAAIDENKQVWLQADRWIENVAFRGTEHEVGEWTVAERFTATRGEYVGRSLRIQLPVWRVDREEFVLADDLATRNKGTPTILVDFGYGPNGTPAQPEAIAVDFRPGKQSIEKVLTRNEEGAVDKTAKIVDEAAAEILLLDPSGKLLLLEGGLDAKNPTREERRAQARARVREVRDADKKDGEPGGTGKPFGN